MVTVEDLSAGQYKTKEDLINALKENENFQIEDMKESFDGFRIYCKGWPEFTPMQNDNGTWSIYDEGQLLIIS